jgi:chemotaxis regulatin CheY-phosphate phosphatase CheZ
MKHEELVSLQSKVDELQAMLVFGKRALPFLEDTFAFVKNIIPIVEAMRASVDATSEKLPKASKQLDTVTHATEVASTEILNTLETMFGKLEGMTSRYQEQQAHTAHLAETMLVMDAVFDSIGPDAMGQEQLGRLRDVWNKHRTFLQSFWDGFPESLQGLQGNCTDIMMALQVQDITAQQIAAVNKLMQSVDGCLNKLMRHFSEVPADHPRDGYTHSHLTVQFDDAADYFGSRDRQKEADALVESAQLKGDIGHDNTHATTNETKEPS